MTREEAIKILKELAGYEKTMDLIQNYSVSVQDALYMAIKELEQEPCDKCVYSTSEGCQYDDITETIPPFETSDDAISRQAVLKIIDGWYEQNRDTDNIEDLIVLITYMDSVNPQKPNINEVLAKIRAEIADARFIDKDTKHCKNANATGLEVAMNIIDKFMAEGSDKE